MTQDIRHTALYQEAQGLYRALRRPGSGLISDATDLSTQGTLAIFAGTVVEALHGALPTRICTTDLATGDTHVLTHGSHTDRSPKFASDGRRVAFLSDHTRLGDFQLMLLDIASRAVTPGPSVNGWVEYLHWSPDGERILLGVAAHGADTSGGQGAVTSKRPAEDVPGWMPSVDAGEEDCHRRSVWIYECARGCVSPITGFDQNIWEAVWCGNSSIVAVASPGVGEGHWYGARLHRVNIDTQVGEPIFEPRDQLGWPSASPAGDRVAVVEAVCSDRWVVAGSLRIIDRASRQVRSVDTAGVDISYTEWRSDRRLLVAGHRGFETVVGLYDFEDDEFAELWRSDELATGGFFVSVAGFGVSGDCVIVGEGFAQAPEIAVISQGRYRAVKTFDHAYAEHARVIDAVEKLTWEARDGLAIQGWLLRPKGVTPHPLVMYVHGGPVGHWHPLWLGRRGAAVLMLLRRGYAVFFPNPRGSTARGQDFIRRVVGDMGGADTHDYLSGIDELVARGVADPERLGVMGGSYGGFMTAWLISQDTRFAAAVPICPVTNQVTEHLISNIPHFVALFLGDRYDNPAGLYFSRSPVMHSHRVKTPTLAICGALDRCTPPEEALQFHNALLERGVRSVLVTYPEEGHGVRHYPAMADCAARIVGWFDAHMAPGRPVAPP